MKKAIARAVLSILCLSFTVSFAANGEEYVKGWDAFNRNDREKARTHFELATKDPESKTDAFLCLALLDWNDFNNAVAFENFKKFYEMSDNPYPYLYAMYSLLHPSPAKSMSASQLEFYEKIANDSRMNGTLKSMVYNELGDYYFERNNLKKAMDWYNKTGFIKEWQVLGTFENISESGFDKEWGAVSKAKQEDVFKDKVGADIRWFASEYNKPDGWFYFNYHFFLGNAIMYAQSFIESPEEQEVYFRIGTSGSLKVWLNDALIARVPEERNCDMDIYAYKVKLNQGTNRVLVQIGQSEISNANFMLRVTDESGTPVKNIHASNSYGEYKRASGTTPEPMLPFFAEEYLENKIKEDPGNLLHYIALGETYLRNDKSYEGTHVLKKAEQLAPQSSFIRYRLSEAYLRAKNNIDYYREIENIKQHDPDAYLSLRNTYNEATHLEKYLEAEKIVKKIKSLYGESRITDAMELQLASLQKNTDRLISLGRKLYMKYPYDYDYMNLCCAIEDEMYNNTKGATAILENYCKKYFDTKAIDQMANRYFKTGKTDKGLTLLRKRIDYMPYATGFMYNYALLMQKTRKYTEALNMLAAVKKQSPYNVQVYSAEGYIFKELKEIEKAKECFKKAIYYSPTSYDSRTQLRLLENKNDIFELFHEPDLDALIAAAPGASDFPEDNAVLILNDNQMVFYPEGAREHRVNVAVKILNQTGIEDWKEYDIFYNGNSQNLLLDKYEIIKVNGQRVKAETDHRGRVVFTNLEVGDILHLNYRIQDYSTGILSKHFYDWMLLQYTIPVTHSRYAILVPANIPFEYMVQNADIKPEITEIENMKLYQWEINKTQPSIKSEPYMSPVSNIAPILAFSSIPDWQFISKWYQDLTENKINARSDYILQETLAEILKGKEEASPMEKAELFYEYILKNITYSNVSFLQGNFIPQKASRTITTRLGDCKDVSTLFVSLCRAVGIKANLVLLQSRERGKGNMLLPSVGFNHCIARLDIDGNIYYLELTDNNLPFGAAIENNLQSCILPIPYQNEAMGNELLLLEMPLREKNEIIRHTTIRTEGNDMHIRANNTRTGQLASFYRYVYKDMGTEDRLKEINHAVSSGWKSPVKVSSLEFQNIDNLSDSVFYRFQLDAKDAMQEVAGMKVFKLPWSEAIENLSIVALEKRQYPLEFWQYLYCDTEREEITFIIPDKKQWMEKPVDIRLECEAASYAMTFNTDKKGEITITRTFKKKKDIVTPEEYEEFKTFITAVNNHDHKQYAIK